MSSHVLGQPAGPGIWQFSHAPPPPTVSRPRASCLTDPRSVACCAEIPPEWDSDGAGREHGISGNITIPKSYNELATLMSVTGALPAASFRLAGGIQRLQAGRARLRERRVGKQQAGRLLSARCCLAPTFPRMITITSCSCCCGFFRRGCDSPPVLPRHPPGVWLRRPHRHAHLLLPRGCLDRWGPRGVLPCLAGPPKECLGCRSTMPGSACCWQAVPAPGWGNGHACPLLRPRLPLLATLYPCSWERNLFGRLCAHAAHRRLPGSAGGPGDGGHCSGAWRGQQRVSPWQAGFHAGQLLGMRLHWHCKCACKRLHGLLACLKSWATHGTLGAREPPAPALLGSFLAHTAACPVPCRPAAHHRACSCRPAPGRGLTRERLR